MNAFKRWISGLLVSLLLVTAAFIGISYIHEEQPAPVWAEDKPEKVPPDGEKGEEASSPCPECPECPECPDPAKVVL
ncbi:MAG TPA: hypothetical protein PLF65_11440, partial [Desulfobacter postgatei]|nr:hypothetical protein [Desulfobacter postgatei]